MQAHPDESETARGGALSGIRVLDLSAYLAAPYGCTLLGDLGAEVIKVEPPEGDNARRYPSTLPSTSRMFLGINRGKRGVVLDLKTTAGQQVIHRLISNTDVLVHNFRPGVAERLGISYESLAATHPKLIYCSVTGYGPTGPMSGYPGYDQVLQAMTGMSTSQGRLSRTPEIVQGSVVDYYGASLVALSVSAALVSRERTGKGQRLDVSLLGAALTMQAARFVYAENERRDAVRDFGSGGITGLHPTREGMLYLSANTPRFWQSLCEVTGLPDLADDPEFDSITKRARQAHVLVPRLREALMSRTALEWEVAFGGRVPCAAARPTEDMFDHPQVLSQDMVGRFEHPDAGGYRALQKPVAFSESPCPRTFPAPCLGQHTREVLTELGITKDALLKLEEGGAFGRPLELKQAQP